MIDVEVDGKPYQEMHVDGGAMAQVFMYPPALTRAMTAAGGQVAERECHVYIIRNTNLGPSWTETDRRTLSVVGRANFDDPDARIDDLVIFPLWAIRVGPSEAYGGTRPAR